MAIDAVVLAGGPHDAVAALEPGAANKAFVSVSGTTLVARTIAALRTTPAIGRIVVVAPLATHGRPDLAGADDVRPDGVTMTQSLRSGLQGCDPDELIIVSASDLPILTRAALEEFVALAVRGDADLVYACIERATHVARYPDVPHTWARLRDGTYCGAGVIALRPRVLPALGGLLGALGAARKNPLRLAAIFGPGVLVRYALGRFSVADAATRATYLLGAPATAAICTHPEIAVNVDRPSDVALAERLLGRARNYEPTRLS